MAEERRATLVRPWNASLQHRRLLLPDLWRHDADRVVHSVTVDTPDLHVAS